MDTHRDALGVASAPARASSGTDQATSPGPVNAAFAADMSVLPVILCGGAGTRLWPLSREGQPMQFWPMFSEFSLLQQTGLRATGALPCGTGFAEPLIICNQNHYFLIARQLSDAGVLAPRFVLEPMSRDSAPAVAASAVIAAEQDPERVLWIMPVNLVIGDMDALHQALTTAVQAARAGHIVTLGILPTKLETGRAYVEIGDAVSGVEGAFEAVRFIAGPKADTSAVLSASGRHLWSSGIFVAKAAALLAELERGAPDMLAHVAESLTRGQQDPHAIRPDQAAFAKCPTLSLEDMLTQRTHRAVVVPVDVAWSHVCDWRAVWDVSPKDARGNVARGDAMLEGADRCLVRADGRLTALVGVQDLAVVVSDDAVLVLHRDCAEHVQSVVKRLKIARREEAVAHRRVYRPWGFFESLAFDSRFQVKRIVVDPGEKLSLQKHFHRSEHWVVVRGAALVTRDHEEFLVGENESIYLPLGCVHRLQNVGRISLVLIEVQVGSYLGEDDIVRFQDQYGRCEV
jgi:mannose-1-phosphate guanylyltransferase/mannose-6-phosphate isomerase